MPLRNSDRLARRFRASGSKARAWFSSVATLATCLLALTVASQARALEKPDTTYKVFQFPTDQIPRIDGKIDDWAKVPESYVVGTDQLWDDSKKHPKIDPATLDVRVKVGWVKGLNRLYFLYEATDNYWDFAQPGLHNDTFEIVVDGDASGGPLIDKGHREFWTPERVGEPAATPTRASASTKRTGPSTRAGAELPHLRAAREQGLVHGVEFRVVDQGVPLSEFRAVV